MDHTNSLPFFIENVFGKIEDAIDIYASPATIYAIRKHLFNNDTWPDFTRIPNDLLPALRLTEVQPLRPFEVNGLQLPAVPVNHTVPTHGYLVEDSAGAVLFTSDTGPTEKVWEVANSTPHLRAVIVEVSFPTRMQPVADLSRHLTPSTLAVELAKLRRDVPVYLYHFKPPYVDELRDEIAVLRFPHPVEELRQGDVYRF
jgi:cAMP phosphodiesterase